MVKKTTGDKTGMDCTQWIATDHRLTRGANDTSPISSQQLGQCRTAHLRIYEAYQNQWILSTILCMWLRLAYSTTGSYDNLHSKYVF